MSDFRTVWQSLGASLGSGNEAQQVSRNPMQGPSSVLQNADLVEGVQLVANHGTNYRPLVPQASTALAEGTMKPAAYSNSPTASSPPARPAVNHPPHSSLSNHSNQQSYTYPIQRPSSGSTSSQSPHASHTVHASQTPLQPSLLPPEIREQLRHHVSKVLQPTQNHFEEIWRRLFDDVDVELQRSYKQLLDEQVKTSQAARVSAVLYEQNKHLYNQNRQLHEQVNKLTGELAKMKIDYDQAMEWGRKLLGQNGMLARVYSKVLAEQRSPPANGTAVPMVASAPVNPSPQVEQSSFPARSVSSVNPDDFPPDLMASVRQEMTRGLENVEIRLAMLLAEANARRASGANTISEEPPHGQPQSAAEVHQAAPSNPAPVAAASFPPVPTLTLPLDQPRFHQESSQKNVSTPSSTPVSSASADGAQQCPTSPSAPGNQLTAFTPPQPLTENPSSSYTVPATSALLAQDECIGALSYASGTVKSVPNGPREPPGCITVKKEVDEKGTVQLIFTSDSGKEIIDLTGILDSPSPQFSALLETAEEGDHLEPDALALTKPELAPENRKGQESSDVQDAPMVDIRPNCDVQETPQMVDNVSSAEDEENGQISELQATTEEPPRATVEDSGDLPLLDADDEDLSLPGSDTKAEEQESNIVPLASAEGAAATDLKRLRIETHEPHDRPAVRRRVSEAEPEATPLSSELTYPESPESPTAPPTASRHVSEVGFAPPASDVATMQGTAATPKPTSSVPRSSPAAGTSPTRILRMGQSSPSASSASSSTQVVKAESTDDVPPARAPLLGILHLSVAYLVTKNKYTCLLCVMRRKEYPTAPVKCFPLKSSAVELSAHCEEQHPMACQDLLRMTPAEIVELRERRKTTPSHA
ncbi:hypothetical protein NEOLEDRAFT_1136842 [Neolentinus lepideus HHB14362 ss-1]|uniref:Uncharacterized protein n=1 Tax=Neolentinus lepideus HHB14362 ss-1 TaxID=1314782 RepID=A0A165R2K7_9AGAM|nr:hypothetical protein NEOLEDRAFT_1136842 [Neolentinus lepideus HHB14362 ss-1]